MTQEQTLAVGQIVRLISGGPDMTVQRETVGSEPGQRRYSCQWFAGKKLEQGIFSLETLKVVEPKEL